MFGFGRKSANETPTAPDPGFGSLTGQDVRAAAERLRTDNDRDPLGDGVSRTPARQSPKLAQLTGAAAVVLKLDNLQQSGAFKERGALNALLMLDEAARRKGVVTASAGNHAQALARHAMRLGINPKIVMPKATPAVKVAGVKAYSGEDSVVRDDHEARAAEPNGARLGPIESALRRAHDIATTEGRTIIHPFDNPAVIAGQGTAMLELLEDAPGLLRGEQLDIVVVPIGGGGLIAGSLLAAEMFTADGHSVEVIGVEPELFPCMWNALNGQTSVKGGSSIAEGAAVGKAGDWPVAICRRLLNPDHILRVSEETIEEAIVHLVVKEKTVAEGAGALGLAAMLTDPGRFKGKRVGLMICGGNIDVRLLGQVFERHLVRQRRWARIRVVCNDQPGYLAEVARVLGEAGANIMDVTHNRLALSEPAKDTVIDFIVETESMEKTDQLVPKLKDAGIEKCEILRHRAVEPHSQGEAN